MNFAAIFNYILKRGDVLALETSMQNTISEPAYDRARFHLQSFPFIRSRQASKPFTPPVQGMLEKNGVPFVWGIPCARVTNYELQGDTLRRGIEWICPHCLGFLKEQEHILVCSNNCHLPSTKVGQNFLQAARKASRVKK